MHFTTSQSAVKFQQGSALNQRWSFRHDLVPVTSNGGSDLYSPHLKHSFLNNITNLLTNNVNVCIRNTTLVYHAYIIENNQNYLINYVNDAKKKNTLDFFCAKNQLLDNIPWHTSW